MKGKVLHLVLKAQWYNMIESGEKREEYREMKPYWLQRLFLMHNIFTDQYEPISLKKPMTHASVLSEKHPKNRAYFINI